jgi:hypothetical protein
MNAQTRIVLQCMIEHISVKEADWWSPYEVFTAEDAKSFWDTMLQECPDAYDEPWFPIIAVAAAEREVNYDLLGVAWTASWWTICDRYAAEGRLATQSGQSDQNDPQPCC